MESCVSVIVPVYKAEPYLEKCIDSILAQSHRELELLLVDDGSPDRCGEICDAYAGRDTRVRVIHQQNAGVSAARNAGLDAARGGCIAFADADDWVEPDWIEALYRPLAQDADPDVSICGWYRETDGRTIDCSGQIPTGMLTGDQAFCSAVRGGGIEGFLVNKLFRAELFRKLRLREDLAVCEDLLLVCQVFRRCKTAAAIPRALYHYRIRPGSALHDPEKRLRSEIPAREAILDLAAGDRLREDAAAFSYVQQTLLNSVRAERAGKEETAARLRDMLKRYVPRAMRAGSIPAADRAKLALKLMIPSLISEEYL